MGLYHWWKADRTGEDHSSTERMSRSVDKLILNGVRCAWMAIQEDNWT